MFAAARLSALRKRDASAPPTVIGTASLVLPVPTACVTVLAPESWKDALMAQFAIRFSAGHDQADQSSASKSSQRYAMEALQI